MRAALVVAILHMMGDRRAHVYRERAAAFAFHAERAIAAERSDLPPELVAAVAGKESSWRWMRDGKVIEGTSGDSGYMQVVPRAAAQVCPDLDVRRRPVDNIRCGLRLLALARKRCGGEPANWLGAYNRGSGCGPSEYARKVLAIMARAEAPTLADVAVPR